MNRSARNELIEIVCGLAMITTGIGMFISKTAVTSAFLESEGFWSWWKIILVILPLVIGIIMMAVKPHLKASKLVAFIGAALVVVMIIANTTIIIEKKIAVYEWIIYGVLVIGGLVISVAALFINKKK